MASSLGRQHTKQAEGDADLQADQYRTKDFFLIAVHLWLDSSDHSGAYKVALLVVLHLDASPIQITLSTLQLYRHTPATGTLSRYFTQKSWFNMLYSVHMLWRYIVVHQIDYACKCAEAA